MMRDDENYMGADAKEVLNVLRGAIKSAKDDGVRELSVGYFQTHMNDSSTEVKIRVKL